MTRLHEQLRDWLARAEILARGAERLRADAARALLEGRPSVARSLALAILEDLPRSPVALALWADAGEAMMLDHEVVEALERLALELPFRADVWQRLAAARHRAGVDVGDALERAIEAGEPTEAADAARLWLSDRDLAAGDPARAERWLAGLSLGAQTSREAVLRRVEVLLDLGQHDRAEQAAVTLGAPDVLDGRSWLVRGRLLAARDPALATQAFERALMLRTPGASRLVCEYVGQLRDPSEVERIAAVALGEGLVEKAEWQAALALARGHGEAALAALEDSVSRDGDASLLPRWLELAVGLRDAGALEAAVRAARTLGRPVEPGVEALADALGREDPRARLNRLDGAGGLALAWADALRHEALRRWLPSAASADWASLLDELRRLARSLDLLDAMQDIEAISVELVHPLRVAVVGEFNTGKSTFVNALLGAPVAPVGVLPTTASLNRLAWAPDRFARVSFRTGAPDRVTTHAGLRETLRDVDASSVREVTIFAPLEPLRKIELLDTPGFNAPDAAHSAGAREALRSAHVALWLIDAAQPLKESERGVLTEAADLGVPLVVLVNKIDRLADSAAVDHVLDYVRHGLHDTALCPLVEPVAFSAKLALDGAMDGEASARSGWAAVEALVRETLVGQSERLRDSALRRRAAAVAHRLSERAKTLAVEREQQVEASRREQAEAASIAARLETSRADLEAVLIEAIRDHHDELSRTLRPLVSAQRWTAAEARFLRLRVRALLGPALARQVALSSGAGPDLARRLESELEPRLAAAAAALGQALLGGGEAATLPAPARDLAVIACEELEQVLMKLRESAAALPAPAADEVRACALADVLLDAGPSPATEVDESRAGHPRRKAVS